MRNAVGLTLDCGADGGCSKMANSERRSCSAIDHVLRISDSRVVDDDDVPTADNIHIIHIMRIVGRSIEALAINERRWFTGDSYEYSYEYVPELISVGR